MGTSGVDGNVHAVFLSQRSRVLKSFATLRLPEGDAESNLAMGDLALLSSLSGRRKADLSRMRDLSQ